MQRPWSSRLFLILAVQWCCCCLLDYAHAASSHCSLLNRRRPLLAFAGGGFGAASSFQKGSSKKKKKKKRKGTTLSNKVTIETPPIKDTPQPQLDKWGLPVVPTEEELFPPMPPGTELIRIQKGEEIKLEDVRNAMNDYVELNFDLFDNHCVEKNPAPGRQPMKLNLLHKSPPVLSIDNFFTREECDETRAIVESQGDTVQVDSATFSPLATSKRTSTTWFCFYEQANILLSKALHLLQISLPQTEEPQIVRYKTGQEFSWHYDEVPPPQLSNGGQRIATLLVYLNTVQRGGGTVFRDLLNANREPLAVKPIKGSALLFFPSNERGVPDDRTLHKGEIVAGDEKWICQVWIHQRDYEPVVPNGNSHEAAVDAIHKKNKELGYDE